MTSLFIAALLALGTGTGAQAEAPAAPAAPAASAAAYSTATTELGTLLDDPAAKAIIDKHIPELSSNPQIEMARSMTLKTIQAYAADQITDEKLALIDADLAKLPAKK
jgi:hypothetical protein